MAGCDFYAREFGRRHRLIGKLSRYCRAITYTSRSGISKGMRRRGGLGFLPSFLTKETAEVKFLKGLSLNDAVVYDIGGYEGLMTLFFARVAQQVVTYEANPENVGRIAENLRLNQFKNCIVRQIAIGEQDGLVTLTFDELMVGRASVDPEICDELAKSSPHIRIVQVPLTSLDNDVERFALPDPTFIKIDIEGMEAAALTGMKRIIARCHPAMFIELHGTTPEDKRTNARAVMAQLRACGYRIYDVEAACYIPEAEPGTGRESHLYAAHETQKVTKKQNSEAGERSLSNLA